MVQKDFDELGSNPLMISPFCIPLKMPGKPEAMLIKFVWLSDAIGKLQKTPGSDVYQWAQKSLTVDEATLKADPRFPRTDREIASKLIKDL